MVEMRKDNYIVVKNLLRLLKFLNATPKRDKHFSQNRLNGFHSPSAREKYHEYCMKSGQVKVKIPSEKDKWLKFSNG